MTCQTSRPTPAACTRTSTSSSPISGLSMSLSSRTSGEPYASWTMVFMVSLLHCPSTLFSFYGVEATLTIFARGPLQVQREQVLQDLLVCEIRGPTVGSVDRRVEPGVRVREPRRTGVVQVRERALLQLRLARPLGVQPVAAQLVQALRGGGDLHPLLLVRLRERERLEAGRRRVSEPALRLTKLCASSSCPQFVR